MRAGQFDRKIDIQRKAPAQSPSGQVSDGWTNLVARRSASMRPLRGDELVMAAQTVATAQVEFRIRHSAAVAGVNPKDHRVIYPAMNSGETDIPAARIYDIVSVEELGRKEGLIIVAECRADAAQ